jgi:hybrid cluster-associated redox disulfide protein
MPRVTPVTIVGDLLAAHPAAAEAFMARHMACVGCPMAGFETIAEAAAAYSVALGPFVRHIDRLSAPCVSRTGHLRQRKDGAARRR